MQEFPYRKLEGSEKLVSTFEVQGQTVLKVEPEALTLLAREAMHDIAHLLRPGHLQQLQRILTVPQTECPEPAGIDVHTWPSGREQRTARWSLLSPSLDH